MTTFIVQIGNSDNKLPQESWSLFIEALSNTLTELKANIHFFGFSAPHAPWQNCCAVFEDSQGQGNLTLLELLEAHMAELAWKFDQDSIAVTYGNTNLVESKA